MEVKCKIFPGSKVKGYGVVSRNGKLIKAHRLAYCEHNGVSLESIAGVVIRHKCDTPACIEPTHLEPGTHADNVRDKVSRGRQPRGESNRAAKLTEDAIREMRRRYVPRCPINGTTALAKEFGCSQSAVSRAINGELWSHVLLHKNSASVPAHDGIDSESAVLTTHEYSLLLRRA
jgi:hypothetical protein